FASTDASATLVVDGRCLGRNMAARLAENVATPAIPNIATKALWAGKTVPATSMVSPATSAATTALMLDDPIVLNRLLSPLAAAVSESGTAPMINAGMVAKAIALPMLPRTRPMTMGATVSWKTMRNP